MSRVQVVEEPEQMEGEADDAYRQRLRRERLLAVNPNYDPIN
jgi:hypothetical protein